MAKSRPARAIRKRPRYKNETFLKALGEHCRSLRLNLNYSIDRLAKESDQLSPASIDRLERGLADSQILVLLRYSEVLRIPLTDLFTFTVNFSEASKDDRILPYEEGVLPPAGFVPVYPLKIAAGLFKENFAEDNLPMGWIDPQIKGRALDHFASFVHGESMEPRIKNGSLCLFKKYSGGSRQGKIFLVQARGTKNIETGEAFVIKKYVRQTPPRFKDSDAKSVIHLVSENPQFSTIVLKENSDEEIQTIAEFIKMI